MTKSEIKRAVRMVERFLEKRGFTEEELKLFLVLHLPDRDWSRKK